MIEGHPNIKMANSIVDYVFRALAVEYLRRDELAQVLPSVTATCPNHPKGWRPRRVGGRSCSITRHGTSML